MVKADTNQLQNPLSNFCYLLNPNPIINNVYTGNVTLNVTNVTNNYGSSLTSWANITDFPSNCPANEYVYGVSSTNLICSTPSSGTEPSFNGNFSLFNPFYNQTTPAINWVTAQNYLTSWTPNTTSQMQNAVNNSGYYNMTSQQCFYVSNNTERTSFTNTYNATYDANINTFNTSSEMINAINNSGSYNIQCKNATQVYNSTYDSTYNATYNSQLGHNTTAEIKAAQDINTSTQMVNAVNNSGNYNIQCKNATQVYNSSYESTYNSTYDTNINTFNTTSEMVSAINNSGSYNIQCKNSTQVYNSTYESTYNSTYNSQLGHNTSAEIKAAQDINTTTQIIAATNSTGYDNSFYNITSKQCIYISNATERTAFLLTYNSTYDSNINTFNTTAEMITAINTTGWERYFNFTSFMAYYINNATERALFTTTYNATYNSQLGHNTTAEIQAVVNTTNYNAFNASTLYSSGIQINSNIQNSTQTAFNITGVSYIKLTQVSGICDLSVNGTICKNSTGTYIVG